MELINLFTKDLLPAQKQYEAIRAVAFKEGTIAEVAKRFDYTPASLRTLINRVLRQKQRLFPKIKKGPKERRTTPETMKLILQLRRTKRMDSREITAELKQSNISIGVRTVERILNDAGFPKLRRRTNRERGISRQGTVIPIGDSGCSPV